MMAYLSIWSCTLFAQKLGHSCPKHHLRKQLWTWPTQVHLPPSCLIGWNYPLTQNAGSPPGLWTIFRIWNPNQPQPTHVWRLASWVGHPFFWPKKSIGKERSPHFMGFEISAKCRSTVLDELKWSGFLEQICRFVVGRLAKFGQVLMVGKTCLKNQSTSKATQIWWKSEMKSPSWNHWNHWNGNSGIPFYTPGPSGLRTKKKTNKLHVGPR